MRQDTSSISSRSSSEVEPRLLDLSHQSVISSCDSNKTVTRNNAVRVVYTTNGDRKILNEDPESTLVSHPNEANSGPSLRIDWEMLVATEPSIFGWTYKTPESLHRRDQSREAGNISLNDGSDNQDIKTTGAIARLMSIYYPGDESVIEGEGAFRIVCGRYIADLMSSNALPAH